MTEEQKRVDRGRLIAGAALLVVGLALTLERLDLAPLARLYTLWPLAVVAVGVGLALNSPAKRREGAWVAFIGLWLMVNQLGHFGTIELSYARSWPLLVVFAGVVTLVLPKPGEDRLDGLAPLVVGLWLQVNVLHLFGLDFRSSWPQLLVLLGLVMIVRALRQAWVPAAGRPS